ncbi:MAG: cytochrome c [Steroidobacteraceae bacterium]
MQYSAKAIRNALLTIIVSATFATPLLAQQADAQVKRGNEVFQHWCAPCHAAGPRHPGTSALAVLYKGVKPAPLEERTDLIPAITRAFVRTGVSIMPPFRKTEISEADLDALGAYLDRKR